MGRTTEQLHRAERSIPESRINMAGLVLHGNPTIGPGPWKPSTMIATSQTVTCNGLPIVLLNDTTQSHIKPGKEPAPKAGKVVMNRTKVLIEGKTPAQIGDVLSEGEIICKSSNNTFVS